MMLKTQFSFFMKLRELVKKFQEVVRLKMNANYSNYNWKFPIDPPTFFQKRVIEFCESIYETKRATEKERLVANLKKIDKSASEQLQSCFFRF